MWVFIWSLLSTSKCWRNNQTMTLHLFCIFSSSLLTTKDYVSLHQTLRRGRWPGMCIPSIYPSSAGRLFRLVYWDGHRRCTRLGFSSTYSKYYSSSSCSPRQCHYPCHQQEWCCNFHGSLQRCLGASPCVGENHSWNHCQWGYSRVRGSYWGKSVLSLAS